MNAFNLFINDESSVPTSVFYEYSIAKHTYENNNKEPTASTEFIDYDTFSFGNIQEVSDCVDLANMLFVNQEVTIEEAYNFDFGLEHKWNEMSVNVSYHERSSCLF